MNLRHLVVCFVLCVACGCTHIPLRNNSVHEAATVGDVQTQQVLDNLAMFVCNPDATPYFSYPNESSVNITDTGSAELTPGWNLASGLLLFNSLGLRFNASRQAIDGFTVTPINDPRRLELMRCAYQKAVGSCCCRGASTNCPDCQTRFNVFYTGDPNGDIRANAQGTVTSECLNSDCCWFHVGCKKCLAKNCHCKLVGHYCGVYVWVGPEGRDELTKLTLAILDYAIHDPPTKRQKEVVYYLDEYGLPTTDSKSVGKVTANIAIDEHNESLLNTSRPDEARIEEQLDYRLKTVRQLLTGNLSDDEKKALIDEEQALMGKLNFLHEQLRVGGLKEQYYSRPSLPADTGILGVQQRLNTLTRPPGPSSR
jgi:hypothetical protein